MHTIYFNEIIVIVDVSSVVVECLLFLCARGHHVLTHACVVKKRSAHDCVYTIKSLSWTSIL